MLTRSTPIRTAQATLGRFMQTSLVLCALMLAMPTHAAVTTSTPAKKKVSKKSSKAVAPAPLVIDDDTPDIKDAQQVDFSCELGNKVSIFSRDNDRDHITMRWQQLLLRLTRVETTTGANRFESLKHGLVWIGIPAKGILLDSKKGRQLANECKSSANLSAPPAASTAVTPPVGNQTDATILSTTPTALPPAALSDTPAAK